MQGPATPPTPPTVALLTDPLPSGPMGLWADFQKFAAKGNVLDMAVGIVIGTVFGALVKSFVDDMLMPPVGLLFGDVDVAELFVVLKEGVPSGPYPSLEAASAAGAVTWRYGLFVNSVVTFLIVAFVMFLFVRWVVKRMEEDPATPEVSDRECGYCRMSVAHEAIRCPHCTSELGVAGGEAAFTEA